MLIITVVELYVKYLDVVFGECELYPVAAAGAELGGGAALLRLLHQLHPLLQPAAQVCQRSATHLGSMCSSTWLPEDGPPPSRALAEDVTGGKRMRPQQ